MFLCNALRDFGVKRFIKAVVLLLFILIPVHAPIRGHPSYFEAISHKIINHLPRSIHETNILSSVWLGINLKMAKIINGVASNSPIESVWVWFVEMFDPSYLNVRVCIIVSLYDVCNDRVKALNHWNIRICLVGKLIRIPLKRGINQLSRVRNKKVTAI